MELETLHGELLKNGLKIQKLRSVITNQSLKNQI